MHNIRLWAGGIAGASAAAYAARRYNRHRAASLLISRELFTEGQPFSFVPLPSGNPQYVDVWSDPVEGVRKLDVATVAIGGAGAHRRLRSGDNVYQSAGNPHFSEPGVILKWHYPRHTASRLEAMDVSNVEQATVRYNKIRYGKRYHVFQIRIK